MYQINRQTDPPNPVLLEQIVKQQPQNLVMYLGCLVCWSHGEAGGEDEHELQTWYPEAGSLMPDLQALRVGI